VRAFADWRDPPPGFFEIDMVEHCGGVKTDGYFVHTLTLTDIASGWTECVSMRMRNQMLVIEALDKAAVDLPFSNGAIVRRLAGYGRLSGVDATKVLAKLYASARL
jgi:hypothetical protein